MHLHEQASQGRFRIPRASFLPMLASLLLLLNGCNIFGPAGALVARAVPKHIAAQYKGLAGQTVAVMVWAERGVRIDYSYLQLDIASGVQRKLLDAQAVDKPDELKGTTFPIHPDTVVRYQQDHPEIDQLPITDTAGKFNVSRLIYIEVNDFSTRSPTSSQLFRGSIAGNLKVIEISPDGKTKEGYTENDIRCDFPKTGPKDGTPNGTDYKFYQGTLDAFTTELVHRLYRYEDLSN